MSVKGFDTIMKNLNREIKAIKGRTVEGMIHAAIDIRRDMEITPPLIPVDLGNLRASWFTVTSEGDTSNKEQFEGENSSELSSGHDTVVSREKSIAMSRREPTLILGFTANYAYWVHENVGANFGGKPEKGRKHSRRSGAGAKFLQSAIERNKKNILKTIKDHASIK